MVYWYVVSISFSIFMKKHSLALYGIPMLVLTGYLLSVSIGGHNKLKSDVLDPEPVCYVQTDIDLKNVEK